MILFPLIFSSPGKRDNKLRAEGGIGFYSG
jgi:hypothetical protein